MDLVRIETLLAAVVSGVRRPDPGVLAADRHPRRPARADARADALADARDLADAGARARAFARAHASALIRTLDRVRDRARDFEAGRAAFLHALNDFTGVDLRRVDLTDVWLDAVRWSLATKWPSAWKEEIAQNSVEIAPGLFEVRSGSDHAPAPVY